jgi:hypothetical protein
LVDKLVEKRIGIIVANLLSWLTAPLAFFLLYTHNEPLPINLLHF